MRIPAALALALTAAPLGCAATPAPGSPAPGAPKEAIVAIPAQPPAAAPAGEDTPAAEEAQAEEAQKDAPKEEANKDKDRRGNMWGDQIGSSFGEGGLGLTGVGTGGGGIGLGNAGTIGHGAGTGTAQGFGGGAGRVGGSSSGAGGKVAAATASSTSGLPPEIIRRIVRANLARIRFCYEAALRKSPTLAGKIAVKFTINAQGKVASASAGDATIADTAMVTCVVSAVKGLQFPAPENSAAVQVTYPFNFSPGDS